ncbi:mandelate racemase/muconate lactonizing enzyme family protein [Alphaproteobacteria bacterium LSUCC0719]
MKITAIRAYALNLEMSLDITTPAKSARHQACVVEIETDTGITGHGITSIGPAKPIQTAVESIAAPAIMGMDPLNNDRIWDRLYWSLVPRGQSGIGMHAIAALDIALWDIKGKALGQPIWRLLGGARDLCPVYATFGFGFYETDELPHAAEAWMKRDFSRLKMTVGNSALQRRDEPRLLSDVIIEDKRRVAAVRDAAGPDAELFIDANCSLDYFHAVELATALTPYHITFFEEPITQNDVRQMADLRRQTGMRVACGQNEAHSYRFRDMLIAGAVDIIQPNVVITGGFTQCQKIAALASGFNVGVDNGGAWPFFNAHLQAGVANGGLVEYHYSSVEACRLIYDGLPEPADGWLKMGEEPGLGFELNTERLQSYVI